MRARRLLIALLIPLAIPAAAGAIQIRASLTQIEGDVMCLACHESLAVAQSPQADSERAYIVSLIQKGETKAQIEHQLVLQYGPDILAKPPAHGFALSLYILPPALVVLGLLTLALTLPRWRRRAASRASAGATAPTVALSPGEARRLDEELSRYGG
jgi:cytochrome c-type biogenesis protein CcmH